MIRYSLLFVFALTVFAQTPKPDDKPIVTSHQITLGGQLLKYTATTGMMPLKTTSGETEANLFFVAYTKEGDTTRPLTFCFNGGPGAGTLWLHIGAIGPRRVAMMDDGNMPPPPFKLVDNASTWLDKTDLVFVDPVGTGFSRPARPELGRKFWGVQGDLQSMGEFIRLYLSRYQRWTSPLYLAGESYGTTRAAGLAGSLVEKGIAFNGVILISTVLNFSTIRFTKGNDLPPMLYLPTYTATAWYHHKLPPDLQKDLKIALTESERYAATEYTALLAKGDRMTAEERRAGIDKLARLTGLDKGFIDRSDLRIEIQRFTKELLRADKRTVGRLDSRIKGYDESAVNDRPEFDPSLAAIRPPFTAAMNQYARTELGFQTDLEYYALGGGVQGWDWGSAGEGFADTSDALRAAFAKNPYMKLFVGEGYFDLATPYFAAEYTLAHMGIDPALRKNVSVARYEAGHMMYIHGPSLIKLKGDIAEFLSTSASKK